MDWSTTDAEYLNDSIMQLYTSASFPPFLHVFSRAFASSTSSLIDLCPITVKERVQSTALATNDIFGTPRDNSEGIVWIWTNNDACVARIQRHVRTTDPSSHPFKRVCKMKGDRVLRRPELLLTRFDTQTAAQYVLLGATATSNRGKGNRVAARRKKTRPDAQQTPYSPGLG